LSLGCNIEMQRENKLISVSIVNFTENNIMKSSLSSFVKQLIYFFLKRFMKKDIISAPLNFVPMDTIYGIKLLDITGKSTDLSVYRGRKLLIVNTASACGYTPQYAALQKLHEKGEITVLGFPCNDFGAQEQGSESEISSFCEVNFGVTFPLFSKLHVKGEEQHPLYKWLSDPSKNGWNSQLPDWNFCKYLIDENGVMVKYFSSAVDPETIAY
jgi:glutathione peroxidase